MANDGLQMGFYRFVVFCVVLHLSQYYRFKSIFSQIIGMISQGICILRSGYLILLEKNIFVLCSWGFTFRTLKIKEAHIITGFVLS